jgi:hypothetical protein
MGVWHLAELVALQRIRESAGVSLPSRKKPSDLSLRSTSIWISIVAVGVRAKKMMPSNTTRHGRFSRATFYPA